jgi:probable F420-dependent oxidoreductase
MRYSTMLNTLHEAQHQSAELEKAGYDVLFTNESKHDPYVLSALMATNTSRIELMTYIAVAFSRTPMVVAHSAHDIQSLSKGRFILGLGSQIKPHVTRRYGMPWSHPAPRMKEFIQALHAIWDCWHDKKPLNFTGQFYQHTLTTHMFTPEDPQHGRPKVMLAAVGPEMTKVAGQVADGLLCHSFTTAKYLREVTVPTVSQELNSHLRDRRQFSFVGMPFIATGETRDELDAAIRNVKQSLGFYASTPAYRGVLEHHGWGDLQPEALRLSKQNKWPEMGELISEEILNTFAIVGSAYQCAQEIKTRFDGIFDLLCGYTNGVTGMPRNILQALQKIAK